MTMQLVNTEELPYIKGSKVLILASKWHREYVNRMVSVCEQVLRDHGAEVQTDIVSGTFEFPIAASIVSKLVDDIDVLICMSVVLKGDTEHDKVIVNTAVDRLSEISIANDLVIINGIVPANSIEQIQARTQHDEFNKGIEFAVAALEMIEWKNSMYQRYSVVKPECSSSVS